MIILTLKTFRNVATSIFKAAVICSLLLVFDHLGKAQEKPDYSYYQKSVIVKTHPLGTLNTTTGLQLGAEYFVKQNLSIDFQYRFLMINWNAANKGDVSQSMYPFLTNLGVKFYSKGVDRFYIQPQLQYKQYSRFYRESFGTNCDEFGCDYYRIFSWSKQQRILATYVLTGINGELLNTGITWDFYVGIGQRQILTETINKPDPNLWTKDIGFREWNLSFDDENRFDMKAGFSFGYLIKAQKKNK